MTSQGPQPGRTREEAGEALEKGFFGCQMDLEAFAGYPEYDDLLALLRSYGENFEDSGITRISLSYEDNIPIYEDDSMPGVIFITPNGFNRAAVERMLYESLQFPRKSNGVHHQPAWQDAAATPAIAQVPQLTPDQQAAAKYERDMVAWRRTIISELGALLVLPEQFPDVTVGPINADATAFSFKFNSEPAIAYAVSLGRDRDPMVTVVCLEWNAAAGKWDEKKRLFDDRLNQAHTLQPVKPLT